MHLCGLPGELIIKVLEGLGLQDLLNCSATCRMLYNTTKESSILQYHIQLATAGVEDCGSTSSLTTAERLAELIAQQESWATLHFRQRYTFSKPGYNRLWELFGGVLAHGLSGGGVTRGLTFIELPAVSRGTSGRVWEHRDLGMPIRDFAIDPAQDLTVVIATRPSSLTEFYMLAMSTGERHPQAALSPLTCTPSRQTGGHSNFIIQIMADFVGILFHAPDWACEEELYIWNWKTGKLLTNYMFSEDMAKMDSFSFISPRHFVVSKLQPMPVSTPPPALEVYDFLDTDESQPTIPRLVRSFLLPQPVDGSIVASMITRSDPSPSPRPSSTNGSPFRTEQSSQILVVGIDIFQPFGVDFEPHSFLLFVHHSTLLEGLVSGPPSTLETVVPWQQWGPEKTRMFRTAFTEQTWVCYVHGTRFVTLHTFNDHQFSARGSHLRMLDFNVLLAKRGQIDQLADDDEAIDDPDSIEFLDQFDQFDQLEDSTSERSALESPKCKTISTSQPTLISGGSGFKEDVVTTLPCRDIRSAEKFYYGAVLIDEQCVIGLQTKIGDGPQAVEVLCF